MKRAAIVGWWEGLAERERRVLVVGALIVVAVVAYVLLWEPPAQGIGRLQADLPRLRAEDAAIRAMAGEASNLRAVGGATVAIAPDQRVDAVRRSLQRAGLWRDGGPIAAGPKAPDGDGVTTVSTLSLGGAVTTVASGATTRSPPPVVTAETGDRVRVRFDDVDYGVWVAWLASTEGEVSARAAQVSVVALAPKAPVGHVRAEVVLDWSRPAAATPARS